MKVRYILLAASMIVAFDIALFYLLFTPVEECGIPSQKELQINPMTNVAVKYLMQAIDNLNMTKVPIVDDSMYPALQKNTMCLCRKATDYKVGDIILYELNSTFVTHRITLKDCSMGICFYGIKSDNSTEYDGKLTIGSDIFCRINQVSLLQKLFRQDLNSVELEG